LSAAWYPSPILSPMRGEGRWRLIEARDDVFSVLAGTQGWL
jgi:hypothetical protein